MTDNASKGYGKRPLWQWVLIYAVVGAVVYAAIYYFVIADDGGYGENTDRQETIETPTGY